MKMISCPEFTNLEREIIFDFMSCLQENIEEIELCILKMDSSEDPDLVHELFRVMHSLKGNCRMVLLLPFVYMTHELEEIVSEMRENKRHYHQVYGSIIIAVVSMIEKMIKQLIQFGECRADIIESLSEKISLVRNTSSSPNYDDLTVAEEVLVDMQTLQDLSATDIIDESTESEIVSEPEVLQPSANTLTDNLNFFKELAAQLDGLSIYRHGRTNDVLKLCLAINQLLRA